MQIILFADRRTYQFPALFRNPVFDEAGIRRGLLLAVFLFFSPSASGGDELNRHSDGPPAAQAASASDFQRDVAPILSQRCLSCHAEKARGGLSLHSRDSLLQGGDSGKVVIPGDAESSSLWQRITAASESEIRMPPEGPRLTKQQQDVIRKWIDSGAEWPGGFELKSPLAAAASHWSFQPIVRPNIPPTSGRNIVRNEIDSFVVSRLESEQLSSAPEADPLTLLRRVTLDLTGLPPAAEDVRSFMADHSESAYEHAVDRLLHSPAYGERWARPWLDLCHFADTDGYLTDQPRPVAWRYRQWLIEALNNDLPFDQMTIQQLAGDLLPDSGTDQLLATGFLRNTLSNREGGADLEEFRVEQIVDRTTMLGIGWMGLTVGCARCHDHKYDPVTQTEFFGLYAVLNQADEVNIDAPLPGEWSVSKEQAVVEYRRKRDELVEPVRKALEDLQRAWENRMLEAVAGPGVDPVWDRQWEVLGLVWGGHFGEGQLEGCEIVRTPWSKRSRDEYDRLQDYFLAHGSLIDSAAFSSLKLDALAKQLSELRTAVLWPTRAPAMREARVPRVVNRHVRGDFRVPAETVTAHFPAWLAPSADQSLVLNRLDLAKWLVSPEHPLTARVAVNRMWQGFFGRGIVDPSDDFGLRGQPPSHPELLDWLASEFIRCGWSVRKMHKLIVMSATYRQSSAYRPELRSIDPDNRLLARQVPLRFTADQVRDAALAVSGLLTKRIGGPSVFPPQPESVAKEGYSNVWKTSEGPDRYRRSLYTWVQRLSPYAHHVTFDAPPTNSVCTGRTRTNSPLQALTLLNDPVFFEAAQALARQILAEDAADDLVRVQSLMLRTLGRSPVGGEAAILESYLMQQRSIMAESPGEVRRLISASSESHSTDATPDKSSITAGTEVTTEVTDADRELASWTSLCSVILNLHEFITRD